MSSRINYRSLLCLAALLLCAISPGQWPVRWHPTSAEPDEGECVAVDRHGNVYVAGKSKFFSGGSNYDFAIVKYTPAGVKLWEQPYNGPVNGDDIPSALAVDYDGNVYCAGASWGNGTNRDLAIIKLDTNGIPVWPNNGGGAGGDGGDDPGWVFHNGAFRTTAAYEEGTGISRVSMAVRQSFNPEERIIAVTAGRGTGTGEGWRTLVIEPDALSLGGVRMKPGWPINFPSVSPVSRPWGIAINATDNTVYVCGEEHHAQDGHFFSTVRFKAAGKLASGGPVRWHHRYRPSSDKPNRARAIVLDRVGNAYVTGQVLEDGDYKYGTIRINEGWDGQTLPGYEWEAIYGETDKSHIATSVDLAYEVENGVLKPYVYVTGISQGPAGFVYEIATIRYRSDTGVATWSPADRRYAAQLGWDEFTVTPKLIATGRGNVYVAGTLGNADYVMLSYDSAGLSRWVPATYNGPANGPDRGRALAYVGAGAIVMTGLSWAGTNFDFATVKKTQAITTARPEDDNLIYGTYVPPGTVANLLTTDNAYMEWIMTSEVPRGPNLLVEFVGTHSTGIADPSELTLTLTCRTSVTGVKQTVELYDYISGQWELIDSRPSTSTFSTLVLLIKDDPRKYMQGPTFDTSTLKVRLGWEQPTNTLPKWRGYLDQLTWDVLSP